MKSLHPQDSAFEKSLLFFAATIFCLLWFFDVFYWHPEIGYMDESAAIGRIQNFLDGDGMEWGIGHGNLVRALCTWSALLLGPKVEFIRLPSLLYVLIECWLLYGLVTKYWGVKAAGWAATLNLLSAFAFLRSREPLGYSALPCGFMAILFFLPETKSWWRALLWGLAMPFLLLDYDAGILLAPILAYDWWKRGNKCLENLTALAAGVGISLTALAINFIPQINSYACQRFGTHQNLSWTAHATQVFASLFLSQHSVPFLGVSMHPLFPFWIWIPAAFGLVAVASKPRGTWLILWLVLGLLPAIYPGAKEEPNRLVAAWPAAMVLAGIGFSLWPRMLSLRATPARFVLTSVIFLVGILEAGAYFQSMKMEDLRFYSEDRALKTLFARHASRHPGPCRVLTQLGPYHVGATKLLANAYPWPRGEGSTVALIHWDLIPALKPSDGFLDMEFAGPERPPIYLLECSSVTLKRLEDVDSQLHQLRRGIPEADFRSRLERNIIWLNHAQNIDPLLLSVVMDESIIAAENSCTSVEVFESLLLSKNLAGGAPAEELAKYFELRDPAKSLKYAELALKADPRRSASRDLVKKLSAMK